MLDMAFSFDHINQHHMITISMYILKRLKLNFEKLVFDLTDAADKKLSRAVWGRKLRENLISRNLFFCLIVSAQPF